MDNIKTKGLIIRQLDYKESSKIIYVLTEFGKISLKDLGSKRYKNKNFNSHEVLSLIEFEFKDSDFPTLLEYTVLDSYKEIKNNINKFMCASYLFELLNLLEDRDKKVFDFILSVLNLMKTKNENLLLVCTLVKLTYSFGIKPNLDHCQLCNSKDLLSITLLGMSRCKDHTTNEIDYNLFKTFYKTKLEDLNDTYDKESIKKLFYYLNKYFEYHLDTKFKSKPLELN